MTPAQHATRPRGAADAPALVALCRAGFEAEAARDLETIAAAAEASIECAPAPGTAFVVAQCATFDASRFDRALRAAAPVFVRSLFLGTGPHTLFDPARAKGRPDRAAPLLTLINTTRTKLLKLLRPVSASVSALRLESPDTDEGKALSGIRRALEAPLAATAGERGWIDDAMPSRMRDCAPRLHVLFIDGAHVYLGVSAPPWGSAWPMGLPRVRMPREAPSRSTMKLAEAIQLFLGEDEPRLLRAGMRAVDLGAAPGGWTWQLAHRGLRVTAVDNGMLKGEVARDSLVTHLRVDGLTYRPRGRVDWMVCDIAEQPSRIAALVARWIGDGFARRSIFNLKLPMKKRYDEVLRCRAIIDEALAAARVRHTLRLRQLYHDREEVTGYCARED